MNRFLLSPFGLLLILSTKFPDLRSKVHMKLRSIPRFDPFGARSSSWNCCVLPSRMSPIRHFFSYDQPMCSFVDEKNGQLHLFSLQRGPQGPRHSHVFDLFAPGQYDVSVVDNVLVVHNLRAKVCGFLCQPLFCLCQRSLSFSTSTAIWTRLLSHLFLSQFGSIRLRP